MANGHATKAMRKANRLRGKDDARYIDGRGRPVVPGSRAPRAYGGCRRLVRRWGYDFKWTFRKRREAVEYGKREGHSGDPVLLSIYDRVPF